MVLQANASGVVSGKFTIPANVPAGSKNVVFSGAGGSEASATFIGQGIERIETRRLNTEVTQRRIDPLAETFTLSESRQIAHAELWFTAKGSSSVEVQIRETSNGVPTATILATARLAPASILTNGSPTRFTFPVPVYLEAGAEYALVVMCNDAVAACATAELGKWDEANQYWVTEQPYQVGVLLSSSNASTWTPHQDRDLAFRLIAAAFTETTKTIALGTVTVTGATDIAVRANVENPSSATDCQFRLTFPDSSVLIVAVDQNVQLPSPVTGDIAVAAIMSGTAKASPVLHRDVQVVWGAVGNSGSYVSRAIPGGTSVKVRVIVEVSLPGTSSIAVSAKGTADGSWSALNSIASQVMQDGWIELTYESAAMTKPLVHSKLELSGTAQYRPQARNLRMIVV